MCAALIRCRIFRFEIVTPADGSFGAVNANGSVTGMIGMVARREAHFAIDEITITGENNNNNAPILCDYFLQQIDTWPIPIRG